MAAIYNGLSNFSQKRTLRRFSAQETVGKIVLKSVKAIVLKSVWSLSRPHTKTFFSLSLSKTMSLSLLTYLKTEYCCSAALPP